MGSVADSSTTASSDSRAPRADSITKRLVCSLALIPVVPATAVVGVNLLSNKLGVTSTAFDEFRWFHVIFSAVWVVLTVLIWRRVILWTLGRRWLTVLVGLIPFVQVVYAQPLWDAGCVSEDILRIGQHEVSIGLWVWLSIWVWWGWEKTRMSKDESVTGTSVVTMTPTAKRLAASIGSIPLVFGVFQIIAVALETLVGLNDPLPECFALTAIVALATWVLIWRRQVRWSGPIVFRSAVAAAYCLGLPIAAQFLWYRDVTDSAQTLLAVSPVIGWGVFMALTIGFWPVVPRGTDDEIPAPRCMSCGYLLIGLRRTRCPECGDEPTLDELWRTATGTV